ncbi:MAG: hypothetical protein J7L61_02410 [Thermoplasmata archaeon]|nr:hypothetical protein [Thermoplasmata archaeon]
MPVPPDSGAVRPPSSRVAAFSCPVFPTEEEERVLEALKNVFPDGTLSVAEDEMRGASGEIIPVKILSGEASLERMRELLAEQRIRDAARSHLLGLVAGGKRDFFIGKQAALMGRINFSDGKHPLGDIKVELQVGQTDGTAGGGMGEETSEILRKTVEWLTHIPVVEAPGTEKDNGEVG